MSSFLHRFYQTPGLSPGAHEVVLSKIKELVSGHEIGNFTTELCFYVSADNELTEDEQTQLQRLFSRSFEADKTTRNSNFLEVEKPYEGKSIIIEIGPRLNFSTAFSTNAVSICHSVGLKKVERIEQSRRYLVQIQAKDGSTIFAKEDEQRLVDELHDRMTECRYLNPIKSFHVDFKPEECSDVDVIGEGRPALEQVNKDLGLAFDDWDLDYYTNLFQERIGRNPTNVECFDLAQSNSEHSRHWFFCGRLVVDGKEMENSLMKMVIKTQETSNDNNVIKFNDNSSAIRGFAVPLLKPCNPKTASKFLLNKDLTRHIIFSAETHNFPTGVAPFPGATTGTGGRIRDVQATGRGAHVVAGTAGYCFGNLHIPGYDLAWEEGGIAYPNNMAPALEVAVQASNGASDYGNKFGEPVVTGFARSFGMDMPNEERREWIKPIMFSGGIGQLDKDNVLKLQPEKGMEAVKVGGPVYRIGVGGGAASSIQVQGDNVADLDFGAVQRGDAEMEQKMNRAIRACLEINANNPICSIHDQGAGGNGNVLKEITEPAGAIIRAQDFILGDPTLSILEVWGAEYQESNALLVKKDDIPVLKEICSREKVPVSVVGSITGNGRIVLEDNEAVSNGHSNGIEEKAAKRQKTAKYPVDLELDVVLGKMPKKIFNMNRIKPSLKPLVLSPSISVLEALGRVLRLPSVASKRYLTNKVDRSVTGLIAQQQCVGPLHTPLADVAVTALSHFDTQGSATAIGEQPIKMLVDSSRGARMTVGEALTNLVFAKISDLKDVKCSANWMWAAKLPGEGATLYDACHAMCSIMADIGMAVDGGKDSLSMAARVGKSTVKAPGALVVSVYAACPDIRLKVTPDLKLNQGKLVYVDMSSSRKYRLGGSALAQVYNQIGDICPDLDNVKTFVAGFNTTQTLITKNLISSGHDVSDGGLVTTLLEMAFAGNRGFDVELDYVTNDEPCVSKALDVLFAEELGLVLEVSQENVDEVLNAYKSNGVSCFEVGQTGATGTDTQVSIKVDGTVVLQEKMVAMRDIWEATSFQLERLQCNPHCVKAEEAGLRHRKAPPYHLTFQPADPRPIESTIAAPRLAVIREEGSNGDREMVSAFHMAGFEVWDVTMSDLCQGSISLDSFRGVVFVGGFSYADVLGSAKGWAAVCQMNENARKQFDSFFARDDTFSLGICNGCQLMGLLGWVGTDPNGASSTSDLTPAQGVCFTHNTSERFESRFVTVSIDASPAMMLKGMEGSTLGVWVAHGEGRAEFRRPDILQTVLSSNLAPVRYVDDDGSITMQYPLNPNGSPQGIAAMCSTNGRHLAMMPHPERCTLLWQWPWMPEDWRHELKASPWLQMFYNAYNWCLENSNN